MTLKWTARARRDLAEIVAFVANDKPEAAGRLGLRISQTVLPLATMPRLGRLGRVRNTRELPVRSTPYVILYQLTSEAVLIVRIRHSAQRW